MPDDPRSLFLATAQVVLDAVDDDAVISAWDLPSVLEDQQVSGLVGHLVRGSVSVVDDYLDLSTPPGPPTVTSAADYFATFVARATPEALAGIRERGAQAAAVGRAALAEALQQRVAKLTDRLATEPGDRLVEAAGGAVVIDLDHYLVTRLIEQVVHLDDLARSVGRYPWPVPPEALDLVLRVGVEIGRIRHGSTEMLRCIYRDGFASILPVF